MRVLVNPEPEIAMAHGSITPRVKRTTTSSSSRRFSPLSCNTLVIVLLVATILLLLHRNSPSPAASSAPASFSGDLRHAEFSWNSLPLSLRRPPPVSLKIGVFSRKWPASAVPGGMERHAFELHSALASRGHRVHVFTSPPTSGVPSSLYSAGASEYPKVHFLEGTPGQWRCGEAFVMFEEENKREPFDVVHSESVSLHHRFAKQVPNLIVSWHGIALEALQSGIYQDLIRAPDEPINPSFNHSLGASIFKVLDEIRFFRSYAQHVATSDSTGEMLTDVYQIPKERVHIILNGVDEEKFSPDAKLAKSFRQEIGVPDDAAVVLGVAGRLVRDKGHPLLYEAFAELITSNPKVYLVIAGTGPWQQRYIDLGPNVIALGALLPSKLKAFYNAIDVFLNPTLRPQGLDQTQMEAMLCQTPVVVTRLPSIKKSIVVDDEFGFMFAPNVAALTETLQKVVAEGSRRLAERGRKCREYAKVKLTARKMAMAYERLFLCVKNESYCKYPLDFD
ncbi:phosphatidylinositol N-acetylglucosaminyltransferase subunit A-like [Iris pallida]|uniref:Phosphatidylinositol N-acetylglucosaminyltransferase subunit A-like n=1 Tax=Iris pallida TaxID=29817 RepID=A0AAX6G143_IRIPA|nr:phosphatidylinositol N-acetylglucosaminyltransferase subunit A-like [Iris pallida]KAJ6821911.1 phosphatidylinositol N-acetylglucosaminyltransferase subunit A-like [Iris pallida]